MKRMLIAGMCVALASTLVGCDEKSAEAAKSKVSDAAKAATDAATKTAGDVKEKAVAAVDAAKQKIVEGAESALSGAKTKVDELVTKFEGLPAAVKPTLQSGVDGIKTQYASLEGMVKDLKAGTGDLSGLQTKFTDALGKLNTGISELMSKWPK